MKTTLDRLANKPFRYHEGEIFKVNGFFTVGRLLPNDTRWLNPSRLTPEMFAKLNPDKIQPDCGRLEDL